MAEQHEHNFLFLRQERRNVGYDRNPTWIVEDVFYCAGCLEYRRVAVERRTPRMDWGGVGEDYVERLV